MQDTGSLELQSIPKTNESGQNKSLCKHRFQITDNTIDIRYIEAYATSVQCESSNSYTMVVSDVPRISNSI